MILYIASWIQGSLSLAEPEGFLFFFLFFFSIQNVPSVMIHVTQIQTDIVAKIWSVRGTYQICICEYHTCNFFFPSQRPKQRLFINFCGWQRIPEPKTEEDPIPVIGGQLQTLQEKNGKLIYLPLPHSADLSRKITCTEQYLSTCHLL